MRHDSLARLKLLLALIGLGLSLGIALSWRLWTTDRDFPYFPVSDAIPQFNGALGSVFIFALLLALLVNAYVASQKLTVAIVISFLYLCLQDQMRWQPWVYQYLLMLLPFAFVSVRSGQEAQRSILGLCRLVIVAVYLWGGIHKCHAGFISVYQNSLAKPILDAGRIERTPHFRMANSTISVASTLRASPWRACARILHRLSAFTRNASSPASKSISCAINRNYSQS